MKKTTISLLLLLLLTTKAFSYDVDVPFYLDEWKLSQYQAMNDNERLYFLVGVYLGTLSVYNVTLDIVKANDLHNLADRFQIFRDLLKVDVIDMSREMESLTKFPGNYRNTPLWAIPLRIAPTITGETNAY